MHLLVISDLHIGRGLFLPTGQINILEDFEEDIRFVEFLEFYSSDEFLAQGVHLVLNGDILNLIQIDVDGTYSSYISEERNLKALQKIINGHAHVFDALKKFLSHPQNNVTYIIGNHDAGMMWISAQNMFRDRLGRGIEFSMEIEFRGVHIEHGHRFEAINWIPLSQYFLKGPSGATILNLPWGSLFCIEALPILKKDRPYIDKIRPLSAYIKWCIFHDFSFFRKNIFFLIQQIFRIGRIHPFRAYRSIQSTLKLIKHITIYPRYEKQARQILQKKRHIHTVIMGHTHISEWRQFADGRYYFNSGTWNHIPSMDAGKHRSSNGLSYVILEFSGNTSHLKHAFLNLWRGNWRPFQEEISILGASLKE